MFSILLICFIVGCSIYSVNADKKYNNQSEVMDDTINNMFSCMQQLDINSDICGEMLMEGKDHSDKKYEGCKCLGPCIGKKMGTMNVETGKWNWARLKELTALIDNEALKKEAKIMEDHCADETNTHCEAGYEMLKCALKHSPMTQDLAKNYLATRDSAPKDEDEEN